LSAASIGRAYDDELDETWHWITAGENTTEADSLIGSFGVSA